MISKKHSITLTCLFIFIFTGISLTAEPAAKKDPNQLFYSGNNFYEKRDYTNAIDQYAKIMDMNLESGNLYFNAGNAFLKLSKTGYAILCYEKARLFMPQDSDLKSNLAYARTLSGAAFIDRSNDLFYKIVNSPYQDFNMNALVISGSIFYLAVILLSVIFILNPFAAKKFRFILFIFLLILFSHLSAFASRYYDTEILKHGIIVQKNTECRYEPIDVSTVYYKLNEGDEVVILNTKNGWSQIRRLDGKIGWVKKEAVGEI